MKFFIILLFLSSNLLAREGDTHWGIDGGWGFLDIGAATTGRANLFLKVFGKGILSVFRVIYKFIIWYR